MLSYEPTLAHRWSDQEGWQLDAPYPWSIATQWVEILIWDEELALWDFREACVILGLDFATAMYAVCLAALSCDPERTPVPKGLRTLCQCSPGRHTCRFERVGGQPILPFTATEIEEACRLAFRAMDLPRWEVSYAQFRTSVLRAVETWRASSLKK